MRDGISSRLGKLHAVEYRVAGLPVEALCPQPEAGVNVTQPVPSVQKARQPVVDAVSRSASSVPDARQASSELVVKGPECRCLVFDSGVDACFHGQDTALQGLCQKSFGQAPPDETADVNRLSLVGDLLTEVLL